MKKISIRSLITLLPSAIRDSILEISRDDLKARVARGSFWALSGSVISKGFLLVSSIVIARILGKIHFGELGIIQSTINTFVAIAGFGLGVTSTKYVAELRENDPQKAGNIIASSNLVAGIMGVFFTTVFFILAPVISENLISSPDLADEMRLGSFMLFFYALNGAQTGAMAGFENFKDIAKINISVGLFSLPLQIILAMWFGLKGAIVGFGITYLLQWITNYFFLRKTAERFNIKIRLQKSLKDISYIWKFSIPAVFGGIIVSISLWYANIILVSKTNGFNEMAIYNAATQWQNIVLFIPLAISQISLPLFSNSKNNKRQFFRLIRYNIFLNLFICLILAVIFTSFSRMIMQSYGDAFKEGYTVLVVLTFTAVLISVNSVIGQVIAGLGRMWAGFFINLIWAIIFLFLVNHFISSGFGAMGLAKSLLLAYLAHCIIVTLVSFYFIRQKF